MNNPVNWPAGKPAHLHFSGQSVSCGYMEGNCHIVVRWPLSVVMQAIAGEDRVELELDSVVGLSTIFTSTDQMLIEMTDQMLIC